MNYVNRLKHRNVLEILGFVAKKYPKRMISGSIAFMVLLIGIMTTPYWISLYHKNEAHNYIKTAQSISSEIHQAYQDASSQLEKNRIIYKEYDQYVLLLDQEKKQIDEFNERIGTYEEKFKNQEIQAILSDFKPKDKSATLIDLQKNNQIEFKKTTDDIALVFSLNQGLKQTYVSMKSYDANRTAALKQFDDQNAQVQQHAKNERVKQRSMQLLRSIGDTQEDYKQSYASLTAYTSADEGRYTLNELKQIKDRQTPVQTQMDNAKEAEQDFLKYWNELHEQYYTIVSNEYSERQTDYIPEINPLYREWTEQESYQDTETRYKTENYTERVYKGSRIVGETKEDIYETVTKTKQVPYQVQVTKTRSVKKTNGQPPMVPVPYDVYQYYYTVDKYTPNGKTSENVHVGKKHGKYDFSIRSWSYKSDEQEGYAVWKQLWNDNEGILKGKHVNPKIER